MSERGEVEVVLPVNRIPTAAEHRQLMTMAFDKAHDLVRTVNGKVLGVKKVARGVDATGNGLALKVTFAVDAPESTWQRPRLL